MFDAKSGELLVTYSQHNASVRGVLFDPDGTEVHSVGANHKWERWKVADAHPTREAGLGGEAHDIVSEGEFFFVPTAEPRVRQYRFTGGKSVREFHGAGDECLSVAVHAATDRIAAGTFDGEIRVWRLSDGQPIINFLAAPGLKK